VKTNEKVNTVKSSSRRLTLNGATPIPRTLLYVYVGVRIVSVIETPPAKTVTLSNIMSCDTKFFGAVR